MFPFTFQTIHSKEKKRAGGHNKALLFHPENTARVLGYNMLSFCCVTTRHIKQSDFIDKYRVKTLFIVSFIQKKGKKIKTTY